MNAFANRLLAGRRPFIAVAVIAALFPLSFAVGYIAG